MRLLRLEVGEYRSIGDTTLDLGPLTVLFGKNNTGKTNALEAIARLLTGLDDVARRRPFTSREFGHEGRVWVEAPENGSPVDREVRRLVYESMIADYAAGNLIGPVPPIDTSTLDVAALGELVIGLMVADAEGNPLPPEPISAGRELLTQALFGLAPDQLVVGYPYELVTPEILALAHSFSTLERGCVAAYELQSCLDSNFGTAQPNMDDQGPWLAPLSLWRGGVDWRPRTIWIDWEVRSINETIESFILETRLPEDDYESWPRWATERPWLRQASLPEVGSFYRMNPSVRKVADLLSETATALLPDFVAGEVSVVVTSAEIWPRVPRILVEFVERGAVQCADDLELAGSGYGRWIAASLRLAMSLVKDDRLRSAEDLVVSGVLDGYVIFLDEPEAHLHSGAVGGVVSWCKKINELGGSVLVATHHEEFLRRMGQGATLIQATKPEVPSATHLRSVVSHRVDDLLELGREIGMHPANVLSLYTAILFVEGPLDVAVLDELHGNSLESAGVLLVPFYGTRNIEGIVTAEVALRLEVKTGVLTDGTDELTMEDRPNKRRSTEEKKVLKLLDLADAQGQPRPKVFGIPERDLLHTLSLAGIAAFTGSEVPGWEALEKEARAKYDVGGSESVNWKKYAADYGIPLENVDDVRGLVRWLDLHDYPNERVAALVSRVIEWAQAD